MKKVSFFRSIQLKFIIIYILLLLVAIQVIGSYFGSRIEDELLETHKSSIRDRVDLLNYNLDQAFNKDRPEDEQAETIQEDVQNIVSGIDGAAITKLLVIDNQSRILGTNGYGNRDIIGKKATEDLVQRALSFGSSPEDIVLDERSQNRLFVKADTIFDEDQNVVGVIYLEASLESVYLQLQNINQIFLQGSLITIFISLVLAFFVARAITKPLIEMRQQAQTMAQGDFTKKVKVYGTDEISHLAETFNDLNDRLMLSTAAVEKEQQKLRSVLANMSEGVIATDGDGEVTLMNEAAGTLIGRNPNKLIGKFLLDFIEFDDNIVDISELQKSGSIIIDMSKNNELFLLRSTFSTVYGEGNETTGLITVLNDVTEDEKMERERREFVSNVSHELRTPLTTMRSYLEALTDGAWEDKEIAPKFLSVTQSETERMIRLVNDLLQLSRMDNKEYSLIRKQVDFIPYFHNVIDRSEMNKKDDITLKRDIPKAILYVWLDKDKMTQVLDNIISNAIKYSPEGGTITCKVEQRINRRQPELLISVEDQGLGIPYDKRDKIFERFYRSDRARTRKLGGSGLGLAITKDLVEAHYGRIWVESIEGKGTAIFFTLPLMKRSGGVNDEN